MKISKHIKIDESLRFKQRHLYKIKKNQPNKHLFILCTPKKAGELFEVIEGKYINNQYDETYVLGVSYNYDWIIAYIVELVDALYNTQQIKYEELKSKR